MAIIIDVEVPKKERTSVEQKVRRYLSERGFGVESWKRDRVIYVRDATRASGVGYARVVDRHRVDATLFYTNKGVEIRLARVSGSTYGYVPIPGVFRRDDLDLTDLPQEVFGKNYKWTQRLT